MTLITRDQIGKFETQVNVSPVSNAVAAGAYSVTSNVTDFTNTTDAPWASVSLRTNRVLGVAAFSFVRLFGRIRNVVGGSSSPGPQEPYPFLELGILDLVTAITSQQLTTIVVKLPNYKTQSVYEFVIKNESDQEISSGWDLLITAMTLGPKS